MTTAAAKRKHEPGACKGILLCRVCAADYLSVSVDTFDRHIVCRLQVVEIAAGLRRWAKVSLDAWISSKLGGSACAANTGNLSSAPAVPSGRSSSTSRAAGTERSDARQVRAMLEKLSSERARSGSRKCAAPGNRSPKTSPLQLVHPSKS